MIEFTFEQVETVAEARWELEIMRYPEHAQHMIRTWQKLGDQGKSEIRQEAQYILKALDLHALLAQACQDGHDTALLNGQTKNRPTQEPRRNAYPAHGPQTHPPPSQPTPSPKAHAGEHPP